MFGMIRSETDRIRAKYPVGMRVRLIEMNDPYSTIPTGTEGTVKFVDDVGTVHVVWDNGSCLGVVLGEDIIEKAG